MNVIINGAKGKMGCAIKGVASKMKDINVVLELDFGDTIIGKEGQFQSADVLIDFSEHTATKDLATVCLMHDLPMVIGTTGHTPDEIYQIGVFSNGIPIVKAANFAPGVNIFFRLVEQAVKNLPSYDAEIMEMHHRMKKDAPSGTATKIAAIVASVRKSAVSYILCGRKSDSGERRPDDVTIHAVRGGDVFGEHTVFLLGDGERVELTHRASSREAFARGAFLAAEWVVSQKPGLYDMQDVLGLKSPQIEEGKV